MQLKSIDTARTLLRAVIFIAIAGAAVSSRLFAVIRFESIIHEFDPWFNFRATKYLVANSFYDFLNWFDDRTWYPLGRVTGGTLYPGLMVTSGAVWHVLRNWFRLPVDIRNVCVMFAPAFSGLTAIFTYLLTCEMKDASAGLLAALFMGIAPGYISRSVAGSYDNEAIAITLLMATFYFWIKALKLGSILYGTLTAAAYFYMVSAWGGYVFITNLIPLHVFVLLVMGRYSSRMYTAYTTWYALGTLASMQIPFVGFLPIRSNDHMAALGVFGLLQLSAAAASVRAAVSARQFKTFLVVGVAIVAILGIAGLAVLTAAGWIAPWTGRFYSLWDTNYAKIHIPIIASVSEHQPTAWPAFFFDTGMLVWLFPAGVYFCFRELRDEHLFVIIYAVLGSYFAGVMVRLMLTLTPVVCVAAAVALSKLFDVYMNVVDLFKKEEKRAFPLMQLLTRALVLVSFGYYLICFVYHCTWVTSNAYSSPSVVLASRNPDGSPAVIDDYREAYYWLRMNTPEDAKVMAWWDYGYQIGGMADRTTLVDNNTWNNTHIATVGKAMSSPEEVSYEILKKHDVDYVLVIFGGVLGYSGDDINKFLWMVRIAEGIWPDEIKERNYFTERGEYRMDKDAPDAMKNSLMYKLSYYRFAELFGGRDGIDRVRNQHIPATRKITLDTMEEAFTSQNWIVRIYKVKDLDNLGRDMHIAGEFERSSDSSQMKRTRAVKKPAVGLRE
ncbi:putative dolichyl-diphosphooligosaccharide- glycosyltransferase subunit [Clavispora lusitaniae]|uniref:Dolichyl-diphosphooligosaccharide-glycosyltransferase subunit n=1 Tax=Clavispora lusitaniae TaxID=36911 RepID=A0ACD0WJI2_CLALS|nr:putative dolichyl-diphosphooligosaccharide- glycosyltransferase subunit [Clavispora lusitaniae]QFZ33475.1 putative dolichyl-diphosphooligosaccharide- glycosyltransferase subunit [Clavispora lusitaniae]QFZ39146.1 putative dolichyl-diphosphooligosaccharide- glycosyltransferase subunit [Clavispora lusitaniae]QFZ44828.1 putative dolichyl-diphosphooligosaccharide- glycosyltransferase subunit [Clavispora lusitaniae]QFZ50505.1 putative dolichyl-diphosphooligosaccharide- glycosyltransferase subunit 